MGCIINIQGRDLYLGAPGTMGSMLGQVGSGFNTL